MRSVFLLLKVINLHGGVEEAYLSLLYPQILITYKEILAKQKTTDKKIIGTYLPIKEEQDQLFLLMYLNKKILRKKLHSILNGQINITTTGLLFQKDEEKFPLLIEEVYFQTANSYGNSLNVYNKIYPDFIILKNEKVTKKQYNMQLTSEEEEIFVEAVRNNIEIKFIIFLLDHLDKIYNNVFVLFSPLDGKKLSLWEAKKVLHRSITFFLYRKYYQKVY